jgi:hypothetical protein
MIDTAAPLPLSLDQMQSNRHLGSNHHHGTSMPADCHGLI